MTHTSQLMRKLILYNLSHFPFILSFPLSLPMKYIGGWNGQNVVGRVLTGRSYHASARFWSLNWGCTPKNGFWCGRNLGFHLWNSFPAWGGGCKGVKFTTGKKAHTIHHVEESEDCIWTTATAACDWNFVKTQEVTVERRVCKLEVHKNSNTLLAVLVAYPHLSPTPSPPNIFCYGGCACRTPPP